MKKILLLPVLFFTTILAAQAPSVLWQRSIGGSGSEEPKCVKQTSDGGYVMIGRTSSNDAFITGYHGGPNDWWVVKLSDLGVFQWQRALGGTGIECANSIQQTTDGGFIVAGYTFSNDGDVTGNHGGADAWVVKLANSGAIEWQKTLGGNLDDRAESIQQTVDGGYIVVASTNSTNGDITTAHGGYDALVVKLSALGAIEWKKTYGQTGSDLPTCIRQTNDGGYILAGYTDAEFDLTKTDFWVLKLTNSGITEWEKNPGNAFDDRANSIEQTLDGGYILAGDTYPSDQDAEGNPVHRDFLVMKISTSGAIEWQKSAGGIGDEIAYCVQQTANGEYVVAGVSYSNENNDPNHGNGEAWIVKLTGSGDLKWQKPIGGTNYDMANSVQQTADGGYIISAYTNSHDGDVPANYPGYDFWILKLEADPLATNTFRSQVFKLAPNPTNQILGIQNPGNQSIEKITISDLTGKALIEKSRNVSRIDVQHLQQGIYSIQIQSQGKVSIQKFIKQ